MHLKFKKRIAFLDSVGAADDPLDGAVGVFHLICCVPRTDRSPD